MSNLFSGGVFNAIKTVFAASGGAALLGFIQSGLGAVLRTVQDELRERVNPMQFGAVGDGVADDTAALLAASKKGKIIDGNGRTYGVSGTFEPDAAFVGLINAKLKQLAPATVNCRTLMITAAHTAFVRLARVTVDRNGNSTGGTLTDYAGIWIADRSDFTLDNVGVTGGGAGNGIALHTCHSFEVRKPLVTDIVYEAGSMPADDVINGMWLNNCYDFTLYHPEVRTCGVLVAAVRSARRSRGIALGGCHNFTVYTPMGTEVDQGFDVTGTVGNHDYTVHGGVMRDCYTYGWKAANSAYRGKYFGCVSDGAGFIGFVDSGQTEVANPVPGYLDYIGCIAIDSGKGGNFAGSDTSGFRVMSVADVDASYPRNVRRIKCLAIDKQVVKTMKYGFHCDVAVGSSNQGFNELEGCDSVGHITAANNGYNAAHASVKQTATQTIANNAYSSVNWDAETYDTGAMHSTSSNTDNVYINAPGYYLVAATVQFVSNSTGQRGLRLLRNGSALPGSEVKTLANSGGVTALHLSRVVECGRGENVRVEVFQDSGGNLNLVATGTSLDVSLLHKLP